MSKQIDLLVIGGGPAGYSSAIRASQLGKQVVVVENRSLGGTCLNRGCIPTKALLESARFYSDLKDAPKHGVTLDISNLDYSQVVQNKDQVVERLVHGLGFLLEKREIAIVTGEAQFLSEREVQVQTTQAETIVYEPSKILIATGTAPFHLPILEPDGKLIMNSDQLLDCPFLPKSLAIVGGGVIGCEFATIFASFGVEVTILELAPTLLPFEDQDVSKTLTREFKKQKIKVFTHAKVQDMKTTVDQVTLEVEIKGKLRQIESERVLVAVGRKPRVPLGLNVELTDSGYVQVDSEFCTSIPHIYAAGDVIGGLQLAHLAFEEGLAAANTMFGEKARSQWFVPSCIYTKPEIGSIGLTEDQVKQQYESARVATYSLKGNGKAVIMGEDSGFCKIVASPDGVVRGVHFIGPVATELISSATIVLEQGLTLDAWAEIIYPHPTVSESMKETVLSGIGLGLHSL